MINFIVIVLIIFTFNASASRWPNSTIEYTYEEVKEWTTKSQIEPGYVDDNNIIISAYIPSMVERYEAVKTWRNEKKKQGTLTQEQEKVLDEIIAEGDAYSIRWNEIMTWTAEEKKKDNHDWA